MSRQFHVYLLPSDALALLEQLRIRFGARVLSDRSPTRNPVDLVSPIHNESIFLKDTSTSIRCYLAPADAHICADYLERLNTWAIEPSSEAIEFSGCDFDGKTLLVGRLYFQTDALVNGTIIKKRTEFLHWADRIFRFTKNALNRDMTAGALRAYVGRDANAFRQNGGKFADSIFAAGLHLSPPHKEVPADSARKDGSGRVM